MGNSQATFTIIHAHAAGIDVGSRSHLVAIDQNRDNVREFGVYTKDHQHLIDHFRQHGITTIAMESTGSYWQTLFNALQQAGFDVLLVGGSQTKNVKGRKTDVIDCIWIQNRTADAATFLGFVIRQFAVERYLPAATNLLLSSSAPGPAVGSLLQ